MQEEERNIFDLSDLSDLPNEIKSDLKVMTRDDFERKIISLFEKAKRELSIDEVTVAYYRLFSEHKARSQVLTKLYNMSNKEQAAIIAVAGRKGVYKLKMENEVLF